MQLDKPPEFLEFPDKIKEYPIILGIAAQYGVDPRFIWAIRQAESGAAGREFGVLSANAITYDEQCRATCRTVAHRLVSYYEGHSIPPFELTRGMELLYTLDFIQYFANIWAPRGAANDPTNLNANWFKNAYRFYQEEL